jgi:hypothetical protein
MVMAAPFLRRHARMFSIAALDPAKNVAVGVPLRLIDVDAATQGQARGIDIGQLAPGPGGVIGEVDATHMVPQGHAWDGVVEQAAIRYDSHTSFLTLGVKCEAGNQLV